MKRGLSKTSFEKKLKLEFYKAFSFPCTRFVRLDGQKTLQI